MDDHQYCSEVDQQLLPPPSPFDGLPSHILDRLHYFFPAHRRSCEDEHVPNDERSGSHTGISPTRDALQLPARALRRPPRTVRRGEASKDLKTLKLQNVALPEPETLERIVSECLSLESMILRGYCSGSLMVRFNICSPPNLRLLELTQFYHVCFVTTVEIRGKNLRVLVSDMLEKIVKIDAPDLQILSPARVLYEEYAPVRRFEPPGDDPDQGRKTLISSRSDAEFLGHYFGLHGGINYLTAFPLRGLVIASRRQIGFMNIL
ncbi:hypothetical protein H6P81_014123 [Aristolochia fimbriata]|uniref:Uncharacterized protein n=1 Tax=Aristolochia fimbriata TaxID=158543 RepID=A0AAV7EGM6_ARIFI|nr:hypothetical protein H6P81_014123 [Aristolochia fimbriata]